MLACRARSASAKPPAKLGVFDRLLSGVARPLSPLTSSATAESRAPAPGGGRGAGFLPAGRLAGGTGAAGLALAATRGERTAPLEEAGLVHLGG